MDKLRELQLKIMDEIHRICAKNRVEYFLDSGSLLGAIRHNGYIPWDDDVDVGMTLDNYDKFLKAAETDLGEEFFVDNYITNEDCPYVFTKIRLKGTKYVECIAQNPKLKNEIFVDIFPYYYVADNELLRRIEAIQMTWLSHVIMAKSGVKVWTGQGKLKQLKFLPVVLISGMTRKSKLYNKVERLLRKHKDTGRMCIQGGGSFYLYWYMPVRIFQQFELHPFEDRSYFILSEYDEYLSRAYGDYMKLPDEKDRITHSVIKVDYGKY